MKKYFVIATIVSLICNISIANNWNLLKSGKRWNIIQITYNPNMVNHDSITYFVKFEGDTTINSHNYLCVYQATNHEFGNKILNGFVREDSEIGMYFRSLQGNEGLLYKYNMHAGDSVTIANLSAWGDSIRYFVADIDSIQIDDKYMRKYTMIQDDYEHMPETWIEGVGSSLGILNSGMVSAGGTTSLLCCFDNNVLIYKNPNYQDCYCSTHTALQSIVKSESEINVYFGNQNTH